MALPTPSPLALQAPSPFAFPGLSNMASAAPSTSSNTTFPLLRLAAELRLQIYEYALKMPDEYCYDLEKGGPPRVISLEVPITLRCDLHSRRYGIKIFTECTCGQPYDGRLCPRHEGCLSPAVAIALNLLFTCRTTYRECVPILYASNTFKLDTPTLQRFLIQIGPASVAALRRLHIVDLFDTHAGLQATAQTERSYRGADQQYACLAVASRAYYSPQYFQLAATSDKFKMLTISRGVRPNDNHPRADAQFLVDELHLWIEAGGRVPGGERACLKKIKLDLFADEDASKEDLDRYEARFMARLQELLQ